MRGAVRIAVGVLVLLALAACTGMPVRPPAAGAEAGEDVMAERDRRLAAIERWGFEAKVAFRNGREGGSGVLEWEQRGASFRVRLRAPVTGQGWRLDAAPGRAELVGLDGGPRSGPDPDRLLQDALGIAIPTMHLVRWLRGRRGDDGARIELGANGLPRSLRERGWQIEYGAWFHDRDPALPRRIEATSGVYRLRLVVLRWWEG